jgi:LmbE family N-acetylglucosaminyl deacetylase
VTILYLNRGEKGCGTDNTTCGATRTKEAEEACRILGATALFAKQVDGESVVDNAASSTFDALIESAHPQLILAHWPIDNHPDDRAIRLFSIQTERTVAHDNPVVLQTVICICKRPALGIAWQVVP